MVAQDRHLDNLRWMAPHPMWLSAEPGLNGAAGRPAILRFSTDTFMDEMIALTATRPEALPAWLAVPETWEAPSAEPPRETLALTQPLSAARARATSLARARGLVGGAEAKPSPGLMADLKLYQPAQNRFYMVAAQLVCQRPGLPDRKITAAKQEGARFVLRRVVPATGTTGEFDPAGAAEEYAFIPRNEGGGYWRRLAENERDTLIPDEERQGLFPNSYGTEGRKRRLLMGTIPVARREAYVDAPLSEDGATVPPVSDPEGPSPLFLLWQTQVTAPWAALEESAETLNRVLREPSPGGLDRPGDDRRAIVRNQLDEFRARATMLGWLILADARRFLQTHMPDIWAHLNGDPVALSAAELSFVSALNALSTPSSLVEDLERDYPAYEDAVEARFVDALLGLTDDQIAAFEAAETAFEWPDGPSPTPTPTPDYPNFVWLPAHPGVSIDENDNLVINSARATPASGQIATLDARLEAALPATPTGPIPAIAAPPAVDRRQEPWFIIRCVFERPNCTGFGLPVVSAPSAPFKMAGFFDPDAPGRDIRIPMPLDISPAGLRKFRKNAGFVVSDLFCGQFNRFKSFTLGDLIRSVLPWPLHKDLPGGAAGACREGGNPFGLMISISIPIVTICAFILMLIMVTLFDIVFRWMPYLLTVIRIPVRGKSS